MVVGGTGPASKHKRYNSQLEPNYSTMLVQPSVNTNAIFEFESSGEGYINVEHSNQSQTIVAGRVDAEDHSQTCGDPQLSLSSQVKSL